MYSVKNCFNIQTFGIVEFSELDGLIFKLLLSFWTTLSKPISCFQAVPSYFVLNYSSKDKISVVCTNGLLILPTGHRLLKYETK